MAIMTILQVKSMGLAAFVTASLGFVASFFGKRNKTTSRAAEAMSVLMTMAAAAVETFNPVWLEGIGLPLGLMGMVLFVIIGNINWQE